MKKRTLGKSGIQVSEIGLGCWQLGGDFGPVDENPDVLVATKVGRDGALYPDGYTKDKVRANYSCTYLDNLKIKNLPRNNRLVNDSLTTSSS